MTRHLMVALVSLVFAGSGRAGGPPPVFVVVDKVTMEPSVDAAERIKIEGTFIRLEDVAGYKYGKPVPGSVYLSLDATKATETRAEWAKWQKAAGTGKVVSVGL